MLGHSLLLLAALGGAILLFRHSETLGEAPGSQLKVGSLSLLFVALAAMGQLLLNPATQDVATLQRLLDNLALYAGLPLLATAALALGMGWYWSRAGWGRWLLVLFALFELLRRMGLGAEYTLWMSVAIGAALAVSGWRMTALSARLSAAAAAPLVIIGISAERIMAATPPELLPPLAMAAGLGLVSYALWQQTRSQPADQ